MEPSSVNGGEQRGWSSGDGAAGMEASSGDGAGSINKNGAASPKIDIAQPKR
jgi:hypothetical protein